ncbi:MAG: thiol-disulfide oxidoreductase DCC family protein [Paludibacter sp.]|jgi:predicted DCC family thiol-disulfide oxidoreductase YuxK|nr:thiol-disulfide oxidoreductase DCC family protein [Paludibacter sp.]
MHPAESHIVLFDGVCNLCIGIVNFIIKRDSKNRFRFAALQSESGQMLLKEYGISSTDINTLIYISGKQFLDKSSAALNILKDLGGVWRFFYVFIYIPAPIRDFLYHQITKIRYRIFGKRSSCMIPSPGVKERFLN